MSNVPAYPKNPLLQPSLDEEVVEAATVRNAPQLEQAGEPVEVRASQVPVTLAIRELMSQRPVETVLLAGIVGLLLGAMFRR